MKDLRSNDPARREAAVQELIREDSSKKWKQLKRGASLSSDGFLQLANGCEVYWRCHQSLREQIALLALAKTGTLNKQDLVLRSLSIASLAFLEFTDSIESLTIVDCKKITNFQEVLNHLPQLSSLTISDCFIGEQSENELIEHGYQHLNLPEAQAYGCYRHYKCGVLSNDGAPISDFIIKQILEKSGCKSISEFNMNAEEALDVEDAFNRQLASMFEIDVHTSAVAAPAKITPAMARSLATPVVIPSPFKASNELNTSLEIGGAEIEQADTGFLITIDAEARSECVIEASHSALNQLCSLLVERLDQPVSLSPGERLVIAQYFNANGVDPIHADDPDFLTAWGRQAQCFVEEIGCSLTLKSETGKDVVLTIDAEESFGFFEY